MENGAPPVSDKEVRTVEDAHDKARAILYIQLLNTEVISSPEGWVRPLPAEVDRIVAAVSKWLWDE
jgi:hypothetical protein